MFSYFECFQNENPIYSLNKVFRPDNYNGYIEYDTAPYIELSGNLHDILNSKDRKSRYNFKRENRLFVETYAGAVLNTVREVDSNFPVHFANLIKLYKARWSIGENFSLDVITSDKFQNACQVLMDRGNLRLDLLYQQNNLLAFSIGLIRGGSYHMYLHAASRPRDCPAISIGKVFIGLLILKLIDERFRQLDFMVGSYQYKRFWTSKKRMVYRVVRVSRSRPFAPLIYLTTYCVIWIVIKLRRTFLRKLYFLISKTLRSTWLKIG